MDMKRGFGRNFHINGEPKTHKEKDKEIDIFLIRLSILLGVITAFTMYAIHTGLIGF